MGLTLVDAALSLTEGRGGRFVRKEVSRRLAYRPSGDEPVNIDPFSRRGLPMLPRGAHYGPSKTPLRIFTQEKIEEIRSRSDQSNGSHGAICQSANYG
jgi:hypothetical protein